MHRYRLDLFFVGYGNGLKIERVIQHDYSREFIRFGWSRHIQQPFEKINIKGVVYMKRTSFG